MAKAIAAKFEARDGEEFATKEEAEAHEEFLDAKTELDRALAAFKRTAAGKLKTADGELFELGGFNTYYHVRDYGIDGPCIEEVQVYRDSQIDLTGFGGRENEAIEVRVWEADRNDRHTFRKRDYRVADLYADRRNALVALIAAKKEWVKQQEESIKKLESEKRAGY